MSVSVTKKITMTTKGIKRWHVFEKKKNKLNTPTPLEINCCLKHSVP